MIIRTINPDIYEVEVTVREIIYGNTIIDKLTGWDDIESTTLKLKCIDCTIMIFKEDFKLFSDISRGYSFKAVVKKWKENTYNFKKMLK